MNNALVISNLTKSFGSFSLKDISFNLPEGYIMGLIGPNGAGKTSLIKLILNILKKDTGEIHVFGFDHILGEEDIKEKTGVVFEQFCYPEIWNLEELESALKVFYASWDGKKYRELLKKFGLEGRQRIKSLSKGMKMKLMVAAALSHDTKLLILDEPTSGLDAVSREELLDILRNYIVDDGRSVLISSHITSDLEKLADYITFIYQGEIVYTGTKDSLMESYCIIKGDCRDLTPELRKDVIGLTEYPSGFEGLLPVLKLRGISKDFITDEASLDDIIVFTDRDRKRAKSGKKNPGKAGL